jgi:hypothetical protein
MLVMLMLGGVIAGLATLTVYRPAVAAGAAQTDWPGAQGRMFRPTGRHLQGPLSSPTRLQTPTAGAVASPWRHDGDMPILSDGMRGASSQFWSDNAGTLSGSEHRFRPLTPPGSGRDSRGTAYLESASGPNARFRPVLPRQPLDGSGAFRVAPGSGRQ